MRFWHSAISGHQSAIADLMLVMMLLLILLWQISSVQAAGNVRMRMVEFTNSGNQLQDGTRCKIKAAQQCDTHFRITVDADNARNRVNVSSDCLIDTSSMTVNTNESVGNLPRFLQLNTPSIPNSISIKIKMHNCFFNSPQDLIADFSRTLAGKELVVVKFNDDIMSDEFSKRVKGVELSSHPDRGTGVWLKLQVWYQCDDNFYRSDCSKFCKAPPGHKCTSDGVLVCSACPESTVTKAASRSSSSSRGQQAIDAGGASQSHANTFNTGLLLLLSLILLLVVLLLMTVLVVLRRWSRIKIKQQQRHSINSNITGYNYVNNSINKNNNNNNNNGGDINGGHLQRLMSIESGGTQEFFNPIAYSTLPPLPQQRQQQQQQRQDSGVYEQPLEPSVFAAQHLPLPLLPTAATTAVATPAAAAAAAAAGGQVSADVAYRTPLSRSFSKQPPSHQ